MPRPSAKQDDLAMIEARREALKAELAALDERSKAIELAARDAGRPVLIAALDRIKIGAMDKNDAKTIATAISVHGARRIAEHIGSLQPTP